MVADTAIGPDGIPIWPPSFGSAAESDWESAGSGWPGDWQSAGSDFPERTIPSNLKQLALGRPEKRIGSRPRVQT